MDFYNLKHLYDIKIPEVAYVLGFLWADGHLRKKSGELKLLITSKDAKKIKPVMMKVLPWKIYKHKVKIGKPETLFTIHSVIIKKFFEENDYLIKSKTSPDKILSKIPENLQHYWWRGYFDGDGCFHFKKRNDSGFSYQLSISSNYKQNWNFFENLAIKLNLKFNIVRRIETSGSGSSIKINNYNSIKNFYNYIYKGKLFGLNRKCKKFKLYFIYKQKILKKKSSKYRGVSYNNKNKNFWALIQRDNKSYYLGSFNSEIDAARAYNNKAIELLGSKAILNNI
jgi:LAGLIDADG DNA endonuclease family protein